MHGILHCNCALIFHFVERFALVVGDLKWRMLFQRLGQVPNLFFLLVCRLQFSLFCQLHVCAGICETVQEEAVLICSSGDFYAAPVAFFPLCDRGLFLFLLLAIMFSVVLVMCLARKSRFFLHDEANVSNARVCFSSWRCLCSVNNHCLIRVFSCST